MGIFTGDLICTDCDGTLTDSHGALSAENAAAIRFFQEEGGLFTVATGRFPKHVLQFAPAFRPNTYQIVGNGTTIYDIDHDRVLEEITLSEAPEEALRYAIDETRCGLIYVDFLNHSVCWKRPGAAIAEEATEHLEDLLALRQEPWHKINFCFQTPEETMQAQAQMKARFPEYKFERSWSTGMELLPAEGGKGPAVRRLAAMLEGRVRRIIGVGDYENDVSMLQMADIGYAVEGATELCLQAADRITVSNDQHALAVIIEELRKEKES